MSHKKAKLLKKPLEKDCKRFIQKIDTHNSKNDCHFWTASLNKNGYGLFKYKGKVVGAHRMAYAITHGECPAGFLIQHACDNPGCVNPEHLSLGTNSTNIQDASKKGRLAFGEKNGSPNKKLTKKQIQNICNEYATGSYTQIELAERFKVTQPQISFIVNSKNWAYVKK